MKARAIAGALGLILLPAFLNAQEIPTVQSEPVLLTDATGETVQSTQEKKILKESNRSDEVPQIVSSKKPEYPQSALRDKAEGLVETQLYIDKQGFVYNVEITQSSGRRDLDEAAVEAGKQYRFKPARLNGLPANSCAAVPFHFSIEATAPISKSGTRVATLPPILIEQNDKGGEEAIAKPAKVAANSGPFFSRIVRPKYPEGARIRNAAGDVAVTVTIDNKGDVIEVGSESQVGDEFVKPALAAAAKSKFLPALKNGQPVESTALIRYLFGCTRQKTREENPARDLGNVLTKRDSFQTATDTLFQSAEKHLINGNTKSAEPLYESLIKLNADSRAYVGLGKIALIREDWASARHHFDKALELDPANIESHYYAAISYRESGRWRFGKDGQTQGISVERAFTNSTVLFQWVLQHDSTYRDVLYQYSLLMKDQERYGDAMRALAAQIRLKPDLPIAWMGLVRLIRAAIHQGHAADLEAQLRGPLEGLESYVRAEELRARGMDKEAESLLIQVLQMKAKLPCQLAYLSLARILAKKEQFQKSEEYYWKAVDEIGGESGAALLFDDLKYILSPQEILGYPTLSVQQKHDQFFSSAWNRRNPTLASPSNPRLQEHYKRLVYAEENYYLDRERFSFNNDRGRPGLDFDFTDMGRVYIRQGPPDEVLREAGSGSTSEAWHYNPTNEAVEMTFQFFGAEQSFSPGTLGSASAALNATQPYSPWPTRSFGYTNIRREEDEKQLLRNPMDKDIRLKRPELSDLVFWDPNYFDLWRVTSSEDADVAVRAAHRIADRRNQAFAEALTTERYNSDKSKKILHLPATISSFRAGAGKSVLEVAYSIPAASLVRESGDTLRPMEVETGFAVYDRHWRKLVGVAETLQVSLSSPASNTYYRLHQTQLKPDSYYVAVFARPIDGSVLAKSEKKVVAYDFWNSGFTMSDPQLAFDIRKEEEFSIFDKEGLRVLVNPLGRHAVNRPMYVYLELYNPTEVSSQQTDLLLDLVIRPAESKQGIMSKALGLIVGEKKGYFVTSEVDHWKSNKALAKYLVVDVTRMQPGRYTLDITVEDKPTKKTISRSVEFELVGK